MVTCNDGAQEWAVKYLQECVYDTRGVLSVVFGLLSTCCWIPAQFPQIYENFRRGNANSLALIFLIQWVFGDTLNFLGCLLTPQLPTQLYQAGYFLCVDMVLLSQFLYYRYKNRHEHKHPPRSGPYDTASALTMSLNGGHGNAAYDTLSSERAPLLGGASTTAPSKVYTLAAVLGLGALAVLTLGAESEAASGALPRVALPAAGRVLLGNVGGSGKTVQVIGTIIAWSSAGFYLGSRVPQIYKNFKRGSTEGLSLMLFVCAVLGNSCYATSIVLASETKSQYIARLPYLMGSVGTLMFDMTIFSQFNYYKGKTPKIADDA